MQITFKYGVKILKILYRNSITCATNTSNIRVKPSADKISQPIQGEAEIRTIDDFKDEIEIDLDFVKIIVDEDGNFDYADASYKFAMNNESNDWYETEYKVHLDDYMGVVEKIDELIYKSGVPKELGAYELRGSAKLVYMIKNIQYEREYYEFNDYEDTVYTDEATVEYLENESKLVDFSYIKL